MTDRQGALGALANSRRPSATARWPLSTSATGTMRWCSTNGSRRRRSRPATTRWTRSRRLAGHPDFTLANPNRLRSLVGAFAANQRAFHDASGRGYRFLADMILAVDKLNPQTAAELVPPLGRWRRFERAAPAADEGRAGADRRVAGPDQGRVRAGQQVAGVEFVVPAKAGTSGRPAETSRPEVPAFAGMTVCRRL